MESQETNRVPGSTHEASKMHRGAVDPWRILTPALSPLRPLRGEGVDRYRFEVRPSFLAAIFLPNKIFLGTRRPHHFHSQVINGA